MKKSILCFLAAALLVGVVIVMETFTKSLSDNLFNANVEVLTQSEWGGFGPMCSKSGTPGDYYMKLCSNCSGSFGHYDMDVVAYCNN